MPSQASPEQVQKISRDQCACLLISVASAGLLSRQVSFASYVSDVSICTSPIATISTDLVQSSRIQLNDSPPRAQWQPQPTLAQTTETKHALRHSWPRSPVGPPHWRLGTCKSYLTAISIAGIAFCRHPGGPPWGLRGAPGLPMFSP